MPSIVHDTASWSLSSLRVPLSLCHLPRRKSNRTWVNLEVKVIRNVRNREFTRNAKRWCEEGRDGAPNVLKRNCEGELTIETLDLRLLIYYPTKDEPSPIILYFLSVEVSPPYKLTNVLWMTRERIHPCHEYVLETIR